MATRKTSLAIDEQLLAAAQHALGTTTIRDTVERALLEVLRVRAREEELRALSEMRDLDLDDAEVMAGAWSR